MDTDMNQDDAAGQSSDNEMDIDLQQDIDPIEEEHRREEVQRLQEEEEERVHRDLDEQRQQEQEEQERRVTEEQERQRQHQEEIQRQAEEQAQVEEQRRQHQLAEAERLRQMHMQRHVEEEEARRLAEQGQENQPGEDGNQNQDEEDAEARRIQEELDEQRRVVEEQRRLVEEQLRLAALQAEPAQNQDFAPGGAQEFIQNIQGATLDEDKLEPETIERLRNPRGALEDLEDPDIIESLDLYMSLCKHPQSAYVDAREVALRAAERRGERDKKILSLWEARNLIEEITGVVAVEDDMCIDGCHAFTGPWKDRDTCTMCNKPRYNAEDGLPAKKAVTIPLGPQLQALRRSPESSIAMGYRQNKLEELLEEEDEDRNLPVYDDIFSGEDIRDFAAKHNMTAHDSTVGFSLDGARLYQNKKSDTWIAIWLVYDYDPKTRYKRHHILPAAIIPGPNQPKDLDSYMFRSLYHLSAIQRENDGRGLKMWDHQSRDFVYSRTFFLFGSADAIGMPHLDGRVGHHGAQGCRIGCPMKGRHKASSGHYYAVHNRPNQQRPDCDHPSFDYDTATTWNIDPETDEDITVEIYQKKLSDIIKSSNQGDYEAQRKKTGLTKPSILLGLHPDRILPPPKCFTLDLMHLLYLNVSELLIPMWRGTMKCEATDSKENWPWMVLVGDAWEKHGEMVEEATQHFPASFHRPPRNPALKINSGFKAIEYYLYVMGLGPGYFRALLPEEHWKNFCKLVHGVRIMLQRSITPEQIQEAHRYFIGFVDEFENLYYQRRIDRFHFCRPCLHTLLHTAPEAFRVGPGCCTSQFPIERMIGDFGSEIRQPATPFSNLAKIAVRRGQNGALKALYPKLFLTKAETNPLLATAHDVGNGYVVLRPRSLLTWDWNKIDQVVKDKIWEEVNMDRVTPYGRLRLPNGQISRSYFSESRASRKHTRITRNCKVQIDGQIEYAEVQFFFFTHDDEPKAIVSLYQRPDAQLYLDSSKTLWACEFQQYELLHVVDLSQVLAVVSMQPLPKIRQDEPNRWFVIEKSGLEDVELVGYEEAIPEDDND